MYPVIRFIIPFFSKSIKARIEFEHLNLIQVSKISMAEYAFEVSSEGELEQIKPILIYFLKNDKLVELIYCSESVELQCNLLLQQYPDQLRILRMPLFGFNPLSRKHNAYGWLTAKVFFMCRYDFFPELIGYGARRDVQFILLSASAKNFAKKNIFSKLYLKYCYSKFDKALVATNKDLATFVDHNIITESKMYVSDLRINNILDRLMNKEEKISHIFPLFEDFKEQFLGRDKLSVMLGSFWSDEVQIFKGKKISSEIYCIVPHLLTEESIKLLKEQFTTIDMKVYLLGLDTTKDEFQAMCTKYQSDPGVWIFNIRGLLCELYSYFSIAYVGGGFGDSVHSLLEPYLANCSVVCGPKVYRSSEYTLISELSENKIHKISEINDVFNFISNSKNIITSNKVEMISTGQKDLGEVLRWLGCYQ